LPLTGIETRLLGLPDRLSYPGATTDWTISRVDMYERTGEGIWTEYRNRSYSVNQTDAEIEEGTGTDRMSMRGRNKLDCLYHEVKTSFNL
jgi:hypothetical protein